ncbi:MAG: class II aldolase/adducin family protein [Parasporobacterium sp.]|nr:class II aldolase/adducin family protein [Parasporobacterium sp.]MBR3402921.1 class II aldolase/adducin family protein [Parasporobacterium sp.]
MMYIDIKCAIIDVCRKMVSEGYFIGTWGNVSAREGDHIILTPSRIEYDKMRPEDLVVIDLQGNILEGNRVPTSEKEVHRQIYLRRKDIRGIVHSHTEKAMSVSSMSIPSVPCVVEEMSQLLGGEIPVTDRYIPAEQHLELGLAAADAIRDKKAVILRNHGGVACGKHLAEAVLATYVMEKACGIYLNIRDQAISIIPEQYVMSEHDRYLHRYGHEIS